MTESWFHRVVLHQKRATTVQYRRVPSDRECPGQSCRGVIAPSIVQGVHKVLEWF